MKFNKKQKRVLLIGIMVIIASFITWISFGGEIFTKTHILVKKHDELLGTTYQEWKDQFILGLDYTMVFAGFIFVITGLATIFNRDKKH